MNLCSLMKEFRAFRIVHVPKRCVLVSAVRCTCYAALAAIRDPLLNKLCMEQHLLYGSSMLLKGIA